MEGLTALLAELIAALRGVLAVDVCPGGWPWAVTALGVGVGLVPTAGLVLVALLRRRIGSRYGVGESVLLLGIGLVTAGLLPWLLFTATGRIFSRAAAGRDVTGLSNRQERDLAENVCLGIAQSDYLGGYSVSEAFRISTPLRLGLAAVLLVLVPLVAAMLVALQARLALRRGPRWPSRFFWLPLLAVAVLTADVAAGSTGHLWIGVAGGGALGSVLVLLVGVPSRDVLRQPRERSDRAPEPAEAPAARNPDPDPDRWAGARPPAGRGPTPTLLAAAPPTARPPGSHTAAAGRGGRQRGRTPVPGDPPARLRWVRPGLAGPRQPARSSGRAEGRACPGRRDRAAHPA